ncbi:hypothetical protein NQ318_009331 [Aromia moschata]|uniref:Tyrosine-protein kinase ephrin type A/B receptor-like domain-containing protein n=1 Tax=Aromia moschata TaxID=1265417 RepID=A0AAV8XN90_9CUCU|nr:hypothetical protein NQ318_009331 [Aromia moschata]
MENSVKVSLGNEICVGNCTTNTELQCEFERKEEVSNKILRKRDTSFQEVPHRNKHKKQRRKINIKFQVRGKQLTSTKSNSIGVLKLKPGYNATINYDKLKCMCPIGFAPRKNRCVQCPKGTFQNATKNKCQSCPFGYYNDQLGQTKCKSCPLHHSTRKMHSKKSRELPKPKPTAKDVDDRRRTEDYEDPLPQDSPAVRRRATRRREDTRKLKWTVEMNIEVVRMFHIIDQCKDEPLPGWRHLLYVEFFRRNPTFNISEQNIVDRKNALLERPTL